MTFTEMKKSLDNNSHFGVWIIIVIPYTFFFLIIHANLSVNVDMGLYCTYAIRNKIFADPFIPILRISVGGHKTKKTNTRSRNLVMFGTTTALPMIW